MTLLWMKGDQRLAVDTVREVPLHEGELKITTTMLIIRKHTDTFTRICSRVSVRAIFKIFFKVLLHLVKIHSTFS